MRLSPPQGSFLRAQTSARQPSLLRPRRINGDRRIVRAANPTAAHTRPAARARRFPRGRKGPAWRRPVLAGARRPVFVQRDKADTDELRARIAWEIERADSTAAGGCCWAIAQVSSRCWRVRTDLVLRCWLQGDGSRQASDRGSLLPRRFREACLGRGSTAIRVHVLEQVRVRSPTPAVLRLLR